MLKTLTNSRNVSTFRHWVCTLCNMHVHLSVVSISNLRLPVAQADLDISSSDMTKCLFRAYSTIWVHVCSCKTMLEHINFLTTNPTYSVASDVGLYSLLRPVCPHAYNKYSMYV